MPLATTRPYEILVSAQNASPDVVIVGSTWIHGTPGEWYGPNAFGFGVGNVPSSFLTDDNDRWMVIHPIAADGDQAQSIVGASPFSFQHLPTPPMPSPTTGARVGIYNQYNDSWMIAQNGNYYSSPDYGATWTSVGTQAGVGGQIDRHFVINNTTLSRGEFYLTFGNGTRFTDDDGATWGVNDFTFSGVGGGGPMAYRPTQDEIYCLCGDGGLRWKPRATWQVGPWNLDFGSGTATGCVDVNPVSDVVVIGYQNGGTTNARTARKTGTGIGGIGGGFDFPGTAGQYVRQLRFLPMVAGDATWLAITSLNELWVSTDDAVSWTKDTVTTLPVSAGALRMEHRARNTMYTRA